MILKAHRVKKVILYLYDWKVAMKTEFAKHMS